MASLITSLIFLLFSFFFMGVSFFELNNEVKLNRKLTEALYAQLGYKYDNAENATKTLYDKDSWLTSMKDFVGEERFVYRDKTLSKRVNELEDKVFISTPTGVK